MKIEKKMIEIERVTFDEKDLEIIEKALDITNNVCSQAEEDYRDDIEYPKINADIIEKLGSISKRVRDYFDEVCY